VDNFEQMIVQLWMSLQGAIDRAEVNMPVVRSLHI
jgi:hypothetical protein